MTKKKIKKLIEDLYPYNAYLLGEGYDARLEILNKELPLEILEFKSGEQYSTWTIPNEWVCKDAWIKRNGRKICDFKKSPLSVVIGSEPKSGEVDYEELSRHIVYSEDKTKTPYAFSFYEKVWGFCLPSELKKEGKYEVLIDSEEKPGTMKIGVHTIPGKTDREILLVAHLDHPWQANDNLSGVACMVDVAKRIKSDHTIKIVFCPETIGSVVYAHTQDISKVDYVIAVDCCGNKNDKGFLLLKAFDKEAKINRYAHCAFQLAGKRYRKANFRSTIGSDETAFNDPDIGIPGICLTSHDWPEYHTELDTPERLDISTIKEMADLVISIISISEKDYIPVKKFKGPLHRSRYGIQSVSKIINLNYDYLFYSIDGKKTLAELCADFEMPFEQIYETFEKIIEDGQIERIDIS